MTVRETHNHPFDLVRRREQPDVQKRGAICVNAAEPEEGSPHAATLKREQWERVAPDRDKDVLADKRRDRVADVGVKESSARLDEVVGHHTERLLRTDRLEVLRKCETRAGDREVAGRVEHGLEAGTFVLRECVHQRLKPEFDKQQNGQLERQ